MIIRRVVVVIIQLNAFRENMSRPQDTPTRPRELLSRVARMSRRQLGVCVGLIGN